MTQTPVGIAAIMAIARTNEAFHKACAADPWMGRFSAIETRMLFHLIEPCRMGEIAALLHCLPSNVTAVVDRLEQAGLVRRDSISGDRRSKQLVLTAAGEDARIRLMTVGDRLFARLTGLSDDDLARLTDLLSRTQPPP